MTEISSIVLPEERSRPIRFIKILLFSASIMPAMVAGALARAYGRADGSDWALATLGLLLGQAGADYLYYRFTHYHTDSRDAHTRIFAGWRPLFIGGPLRNEHSLPAGILCLSAALIVGVYFFMQAGTPVLWFVLAGGIVSVFFTPLMMRGLKEPVIFITFGPLCVSGVDFVLTRQLRLEPFVASLPVGFLVTLVAYLKGARYRVIEDGGSEVILNLKPRVAAILLILAYATLAMSPVSRHLPPWALLGLISLPFSWLFWRRLQRQKRIADYLWATVHSLVIFIATCLFMAFGILLSTAAQE